MTPNLIGYLSSIVLLLTIGSQIHKQWKEGTSKGVSVWLFAGQLAASIGFTIYSRIIESTIFVITNSCMAIAACTGLGIVYYHRWRAHRESARTNHFRIQIPKGRLSYY